MVRETERNSEVKRERQGEKEGAGIEKESERPRQRVLLFSENTVHEITLKETR